MIFKSKKRVFKKKISRKKISRTEINKWKKTKKTKKNQKNQKNQISIFGGGKMKQLKKGKKGKKSKKNMKGGYRRPQFIYVDNKNNVVQNKKILHRINKLRIPPGYDNVIISDSPETDLQAVGVDNKGRKQYIYNPKFVEKRSQQKYKDLINFGGVISKIRKDINNNIRDNGTDESSGSSGSKNMNNKDLIVSLILYLADKCHFRIGNEKYCRDNKSYGLTTLKPSHFKFDNSDNVKIEFMGKKNVINNDKVRDPVVSRLLKNLVSKYGDKDYVFNYIDNNGNIKRINPSDVNNTLKKYHPDITIKMFRTWDANHNFLKQIYRKYMDNKKSETQNTEMKNNNETNPKRLKKNVTEIMKVISNRLHNTPAVSRRSYVDNELVSMYIENPYKIYHHLDNSGINETNYNRKIHHVLMDLLNEKCENCQDKEE